MISDESLPKREHVVKTKDFRRVYKKGSCFRKESFILYIMPNGLALNRIGFSISSRYFKLASARNKLRRILKEVYRRKKRSLKQGVDIIFIAGKGAGKIFRYRDLERIAVALFEKSGIVA